MNSQFLLTGIGSKGSCIVGKVMSEIQSGCKQLFIVKNEGNKLTDIGREENLIYIDTDNLLLNDPVSVQKLFQKRSAEFVGKIQNGVLACIIAADFEDPIAVGVVSTMCKLINRIGMPIFIFAKNPELTAGRKRILTARLTMEDIAQYVQTMICFSNRDSNVNIAQQIKVFISALLSTNEIHTDTSWIVSNNNNNSRLAILNANSSGVNRAANATQKLLSNERLKLFLHRPARILVHYEASHHLSLQEVDRSASEISRAWGAEVDLAFSVTINERLKDTLNLGMIVKDLESDEKKSSENHLNIFPCD